MLPILDICVITCLRFNHCFATCFSSVSVTNTVAPFTDWKCWPFHGRKTVMRKWNLSLIKVTQALWILYSTTLCSNSFSKLFNFPRVFRNIIFELWHEWQFGYCTFDLNNEISKLLMMCQKPCVLHMIKIFSKKKKRCLIVQIKSIRTKLILISKSKGISIKIW